MTDGQQSTAPAGIQRCRQKVVSLYCGHQISLLLLLFVSITYSSLKRNRVMAFDAKRHLTRGRVFRHDLGG